MKKKIAVIIAIILVVLVCVALIIRNCNDNVEVTEPSVTEVLYSYRNTDVDDEKSVRTLLDLINVSEYKIDSIDIRLFSGVKRLTVNFKVDDRADHRHIDEEALHKNTALIFALVPDAEEISYLFFDKYKDVADIDVEVYHHELSFYGCYYNKNFLYERPGMESFNSEYVINASDTFEDFEKYYNAVMQIKVPETKSLIYDAVNEVIGSDCEVVANSGIGAEFVLDDEFFHSKNYTVLKSVMTEQFANTLSKHSGKTMSVLKQDVRNFKTNEYRKFVFLYYINDVGNVTIIDTKYLENDEEINAIHNLMAKNN